VANALPLFHVHGLVLGILGPLRRGGCARYVGQFGPGAIAAALGEDATMLFGVPTMYRRLADAAEQDAQVAAALGRARLLVSGSNALPPAEHARIEALTGQRIVERYGMTETLMNASTRADGDRRAGTVRPPLHGVQVRLVDDGGRTLDTTDGQTMGEIHVRGPNVFLEYLNLPDATAGAFHEGWFATDDVATRSADGYLHIVGRRATDLIESGGYKIGAGEIEDVLREHPAVEDAAVTGEPDDDLGERIVAWVVRRPGKQVSGDELVSYVARMLDPHKHPRFVRFVDELPHDALGKVQKNRLPR
jgi:malonyl-CoA/methylmalonyl-CoA synthetase